MVAIIVEINQGADVRLADFILRDMQAIVLQWEKFAGTRGPRVLPGTYTIRMTKGGKVSETKLTVGIDRRAKFTRSLETRR